MGFLLFLSDLMVPLIIFYIVGFGILAKRQVFDDFLRGAKEGVQSTPRRYIFLFLRGS